MVKDRLFRIENCFEQSISSVTSEKDFNNTNEVVRAESRLLEEHENRVKALRGAIQEGSDSGVSEDFNPDDFLTELKMRK